MTIKTLVLNGRSISLEDGSVGGRDHPTVPCAEASTGPEAIALAFCLAKVAFHG